jgi:hypothetical protein
MPGSKGGTLHYFRLEFFAVPSNAFMNSYVADFVLWVILEVTHSVTGTHSDDTIFFR